MSSYRVDLYPSIPCVQVWNARSLGNWRIFFSPRVIAKHIFGLAVGLFLVTSLGGRFHAFGLFTTL
jgi:hypothetical protein